MNFGLQETVSTTPAGKGEGGDRAESQAGHPPTPALPTRLCLIPASGPQPLPMAVRTWPWVGDRRGAVGKTIKPQSAG